MALAKSTSTHQRSKLVSRLLLDAETRQEAFKAGLVSIFLGFLDIETLANDMAAEFADFSLQDSLKNALINEQGYQKLAAYFVKKPTSWKKISLGPLRNMLSHAVDIRKQFCQGQPGLLEVFRSLGIESTLDGISVCGIILALSPNFSDTAGVVQAVKETLFSAVTGDHLENKNMSLDCLMEAAAMPDVRPNLLKLGVKELLQPFVDDVSSASNFVSVLIIALLSASDVNASTPSGNTPTSPMIIFRIIAALRTFATGTAAEVQTVPGFVANCKLILMALRSLATNEANLQELKSQDVVSVLKELLHAREGDLFRESVETLEEATKVVWTLSFDKNCMAQLIEAGFVDILKSFSTDDARVKEEVEGALWNLEAHSRASESGDSLGTHVMISYSHEQKEEMRELAQDLKEAGVHIWIDVEQMEGSLLQKMAFAVENSYAVVVGMSLDYNQSRSCRTEAEYAHELNKPMIFVKAKDDYKARGWLGLILGKDLWYSPWAKSSDYKTQAAEIIKVLAKKPRLNIGPMSQGVLSARMASGDSPKVTGRPRADLKPYADVVLPNFGDPLPLDVMTAENVLTWTNAEVCRWLKMTQLDDLLAPFVWHKITGLSLRGLHDDPKTIEYLLHYVRVDHLGVCLDFRYHLAQLFTPPGSQLAGELNLEEFFLSREFFSLNFSLQTLL